MNDQFEASSVKGSCDTNTMDVEHNPSYFFIIFLVSFDGMYVSVYIQICMKICILGKWTNKFKNAKKQEVAIEVLGQV